MAGFWEYYASTAKRMRNVRYLVASKTVMRYNCSIKKENITLHLCNYVPLSPVGLFGFTGTLEDGVDESKNRLLQLIVA